MRGGKVHGGLNSTQVITGNFMYNTWTHIALQYGNETKEMVSFKINVELIGTWWKKTQSVLLLELVTDSGDQASLSTWTMELKTKVQLIF